MPKKRSLLGPVKDRKKTDIYVSKTVRDYVDSFAELLGVPRNVVYTLAVAQFAAANSALLKAPTKRKTVLSAMEKTFTGILDEVKKVS